MFSSTDRTAILVAQQTLNSLAMKDFETLCNSVVSRICAETTPSAEKHLGDSLNLTPSQYSACTTALQVIFSACILHLTKPLVLLDCLQNTGITPERAENVASLWALNAQKLVTKARGEGSIEAEKLSLVGWEVQADISNLKPMVAMEFKVGEERKVLNMDRAQVEMLFEELQSMQKELDALQDD